MSENDFHIQSSSNALCLTFDQDWAINGYKNRFGASFVKHAKNLQAKKWALLDDISNWPVKSPEDMEMCNDISHSLVGIGFSHCAVSGHKYAISKWMMKKVVPDEVEIAFFDTITEAKSWLENLGYDTNFI